MMRRNILTPDPVYLNLWQELIRFKVIKVRCFPLQNCFAIARARKGLKRMFTTAEKVIKCNNILIFVQCSIFKMCQRSRSSDSRVGVDPPLGLTFVGARLCMVKKCSDATSVTATGLEHTCAEIFPPPRAETVPSKVILPVHV